MNNHELYKLLDIPNEVIEKLNIYETGRNISIDDDLKSRLLDRNTWDEAVKSLQELVGEDPDGLNILWEELNIACESYDEYVKRGISENIFVDTMKFCTRFLNEHKNTYDSYRYVWAWWFPRQLSLGEFRIGALEYELADGENREIYIHIPSDANLGKESVAASLNSFYDFRKTYFPEWEDVRLVCDSWLLSPALKELLDDNSNIMEFQRLFELEYTDYDSIWFLGWVYPGAGDDYNNLPEKTSLQRNMKNHLLAGKKVGCAKGYLK